MGVGEKARVWGVAWATIFALFALWAPSSFGSSFGTTLPGEGEFAGTCSENNCYNFAINVATDDFAQPGAVSGRVYDLISCENSGRWLGVVQAAINDGLIPVQSPDECGELRTVALAIAPGIDFHWYRREASGNWWHKVSQRKPTSLDEEGMLIRDLEKASRGIYRELCGYFCVDPAHLKIKARAR